MAGGGQLTLSADWFDRRTAAAPRILGERARQYLGRLPETRPLPEMLATAATAALDEVARQPEGRAAALDLLAADALVTLALLAQAEAEPARLREFAARLLQAELARA
jgi:hypothetical protein